MGPEQDRFKPPAVRAAHPTDASHPDEAAGPLVRYGAALTIVRRRRDPMMHFGNAAAPATIKTWA
jgi:hypothetical protein